MLLALTLQKQHKAACRRGLPLTTVPLAEKVGESKRDCGPAYRTGCEARHRGTVARRRNAMKALVLEAKWEPKSGYVVSEFEKQTG